MPITSPDVMRPCLIPCVLHHEIHTARRPNKALSHLLLYQQKERSVRFKAHYGRYISYTLMGIQKKDAGITAISIICFLYITFITLAS